MKLFLSSFIVFILLSILYSGCKKDSTSPVAPPQQQSPWTELDPGVNAGFYDVHFIDANSGYAVGSGGMIIKTENGGINWTRQTSNTTQYLYGVFAIDNNDAYAVGSNGTILKTTNGGVTWWDIGWQYTSTLLSVYFTDHNFGYVVGDNGDMVMTVDGFAHYTDWTFGSGDVYLKSVYFCDALTGFIAGNSQYIWKTTNRGYNWSSQNTSGIAFNEVCFPSSNVGYLLAGHGAVYTTINGGQTWVQYTTIHETEGLYGMCFVSDYVGYVVGEDGLILKTKDGGLEWTVQILGAFPNPDLRSVCFINSTTGFAVGVQSKILKTTSGGE